MEPTNEKGRKGWKKEKRKKKDSLNNQSLDSLQVSIFDGCFFH